MLRMGSIYFESLVVGTAGGENYRPVAGVGAIVYAYLGAVELGNLCRQSLDGSFEIGSRPGHAFALKAKHYNVFYHFFSWWLVGWSW